MLIKENNAASMQQRYLVFFCCKSRKVQLCLQSSAEAVHHQCCCCCFLPPAVVLVILCSSCSDGPPGRRLTLKNVCLRLTLFVNKDSLSASNSLWFVGFTDFVAAHCLFLYYSLWVTLSRSQGVTMSFHLLGAEAYVTFPSSRFSIRPLK